MTRYPLPRRTVGSTSGRFGASPGTKLVARPFFGSASAISSRLIPSATNSLIFSITCGVNFVRLPEPAFVIVMAAPFVGSKCTVCDSGTPRCDGHHKMSIFRARGGEANSAAAVHHKRDPHLRESGWHAPPDGSSLRQIRNCPCQIGVVD